MFNFDHLRRRQEQRLVPVLESWNEAKAHLEKAIALAETREREFHEVSEDVQRKLGAMDLVIGMANEIGEEIPTERLLNAAGAKPAQMLLEEASGGVRPSETTKASVQARSTAPDLHGFDRLLRASSRPLFPPRQRSKYISLSILQ